MIITKQQLKTTNYPLLAILSKLYPDRPAQVDKVEQMWMELDEEDRMYARMEKKWRQNLAKLRFQLAREAKKHPKARQRYYDSEQNALYQAYKRNPTPELEQKIVQIEKVRRGISVSQDMIDIAKQYPLENLLQIKNGKAKCIAHEDSNPSMNCKNNWVYCHTCHFSGDPITVYRTINNCSFVEAVLALNI